MPMKSSLSERNLAYLADVCPACRRRLQTPGLGSAARSRALALGLSMGPYLLAVMGDEHDRRHAHTAVESVALDRRLAVVPPRLQTTWPVGVALGLARTADRRMARAS